jgi:hypothetical protein
MKTHYDMKTNTKHITQKELLQTLWYETQKTLINSSNASHATQHVKKSK